ncbi:MAG: restriction endonuclease [bacterium]|nr:restriction endonuclease [bacterium]
MTTNLINLQDALIEIKKSIENAIISNGTEGKNNLIRSQKPIKLLHEVVKTELMKNEINPVLIKPSLGINKGELKLSGFFKKKDQDICVVQKHSKPIEEILNFEGVLYGKKDIYGKDYTEKILSINIRSQLSSTEKNFDTLFERTFAEALNLHLRCPKMVLGEFYMIPVREYDSDEANNKRVKFKELRRIEKHIEKYLLSFNSVNKRISIETDYYKYERVCLLIVDFNKRIPKIYNSNHELEEDLLIPKNSKASINNLTFASFINDLVKIYTTRFGEGNFN